jgi:CPA1 family monovalent cation:H+ antiporter
MRLPSYAVWETVVFVLNVLAFVLIGLQVRPILDSLEAAERTHYLQVAAAVLATVVLVRIAWVFTYNRAAYYKNKFFGPGYWPGKFLPPVSGSTIVSWCGMRGIVTLAAAYALPRGFPYRDLILLCAFVVVVGTLIVQGLTLRPLIRAFKLRYDGTVEKEVRTAQEALAKIATTILDGDGSPTAKVLREEFAVQKLEDITDGTESERDARNRLRSSVVTAQRRELIRLRDEAVIGDDAFHRVEERLDWTEINAR